MLIVLTVTLASVPFARTPRAATIAADDVNECHAVLAFVGDLMVHSWQADAAYDKKTGEYDFTRSFEHVAAYLHSADFAVGNLETTFAGGRYSDYPAFCAPDSFAEALGLAGFGLVSTANNHCYDKGYDGLARTLDVLDMNGIDHTGTYRSEEESDTPCVRDINGIRFAFVSFTYGTNGISVAKDRPYSVNLINEDVIKKQIDAAKEFEPDFIIALPHMGTEYATEPSAYAKKWAGFMLECGADAVVACHPHLIQTVEVTDDGKFIAYSTANFISSQRTLPRDCGMILNMEFVKSENEKCECVRVSIIPTWVKFVNSAGAYDIQTLPVYDALLDYEDENLFLLRQKDVPRLRDVIKELTKTILGEAATEIQKEYVVYEK